jgi:hypothetical protein
LICSIPERNELKELITLVALREYDKASQKLMTLEGKLGHNHEQLLKIQRDIERNKRLDEFAQHSNDKR